MYYQQQQWIPGTMNNMDNNDNNCNKDDIVAGRWNKQLISYISHTKQTNEQTNERLTEQTIIQNDNDDDDNDNDNKTTLTTRLLLATQWLSYTGKQLVIYHVQNERTNDLTKWWWWWWWQQQRWSFFHHHIIASFSAPNTTATVTAPIHSCRFLFYHHRIASFSALDTNTT